MVLKLVIYGYEIAIELVNVCMVRRGNLDMVYGLLLMQRGLIKCIEYSFILCVCVCLFRTFEYDILENKEPHYM